MKLCNSEMMREMDNYAINVQCLANKAFGIPGAILMSRSAQHVADAVSEILKTNSAEIRFS